MSADKHLETWAQASDHQTAWWGTQPCRECNTAGLPKRTLNPGLLPRCPNPECGGTGWTVWASFAQEPWTEIIPGLWVGGHDFCTLSGVAYGDRQSIAPGNLFDVVVSAYHRPGFEPSAETEHHQMLFPDSSDLSPESLRLAMQAAAIVENRVLGGQKVLVRCQAGLNRASLISGLAMVRLGFEGPDVVQLIRSRRSPWALCNEEYATLLSTLSAGTRTVPTRTN